MSLGWPGGWRGWGWAPLLAALLCVDAIAALRERVAALCDPGSSFLELALWAAHDLYAEWGGAPGAGVVALRPEQRHAPLPAATEVAAHGEHR